MSHIAWVAALLTFIVGDPLLTYWTMKRRGRASLPPGQDWLLNNYGLGWVLVTKNMVLALSFLGYEMVRQHPVRDFFPATLIILGVGGMLLNVWLVVSDEFDLF